MKKLIIATGLLMATSAYAQTEVLTGVTRGKDYGVVYSLPKTQIELEIKANKVSYTPGEFSKYADRYLRLTNVSAEPDEYWELNSVKVKSVGVPNSETTYFVKLKDKTVAPLMELTEDGIVKSINVPYSKSNEIKKAAPVTPATVKANPRDFLTEEILMASSTAKMAELVAKFDPHFLYNTLSLINWKALAAGEEDISRMTLALSTFYRTALNRGRNVLQVETELSNTRAYLEIQSMLHDGDFDYEIEAQTEILQCESLNLILQPLVENAIHHGIEEKTDGRGKITVRGWKEDNCVWFMVEDNGVGMEQEVADKILTMESKGYGVRNVDERIRLCYGEKYAMKVESVVGKGTKMTIHFPARRLTNIQKSQIS